jgi:hypothetical protein
MVACWSRRPRAPWSLRDDLACAAAGPGAAATLLLIALLGEAPSEPRERCVLRLAVVLALGAGWSLLATPLLIARRLATRSGVPSWPRPELARVGLTTVLVALTLVSVGSGETSLLVGGSIFIVGGLLVLVGAARRAEPRLALARALPALRVAAVSLALLGAMDLAVVAPLRGELLDRWADAWSERLLHEADGRRQAVAELLAQAPDAPRTALVRDAVRAGRAELARARAVERTAARGALRQPHR